MTDLKKLLADLHVKLAQELLGRVQSGEATATDLNVVRQFLKDNGIDSTASASPAMKKLADILPFTDVNEGMVGNG